MITHDLCVLGSPAGKDHCCHFVFLLQVLRQEAGPDGSVWVRYLKPWNWGGKQVWKWEDTASYLMEYPVPAADIIKKMEDVHLHDNGRNVFYTFD